MEYTNLVEITIAGKKIAYYAGGMWIIAALIFLVIGLHKLLAGAFFGFLVMVCFAGFAVFLNKSGLDLS
ncbi:MAG: hypothetical protein KW788_03740 [Candidatus Doudnabacteria bacterium]|nr:hypothetical protein [Candidatus Doudnabacteria bacterium]